MSATPSPMTSDFPVLANPVGGNITVPNGVKKNEFPYEPHSIYAGHMLSMIAFQGNITMNTHEAILHAQDGERKATGGRAGLWQGFKNHAGEGQVRSRNECAWQLLESPCEFHDLLDTDLLPTPEHFKRLRAHPEAKDSIICAPYFAKQQRIQLIANFLKTDPEGKGERTPTGLMPLAKGGTGFMQIPRAAYERIMRKFPGRFYYCDYDRDPVTGMRKLRYSFFAHDIAMDYELGFMRDQSEDWWFCDMARKAGVKIYLDATLTGDDGTIAPVWHRGIALYPLPAEMERLHLEARVAELEAQLAGKITVTSSTTTASDATVTISQ